MHCGEAFAKDTTGFYGKPVAVRCVCFDMRAKKKRDYKEQKYDASFFKFDAIDKSVILESILIQAKKDRRESKR